MVGGLRNSISWAWLLFMMNPIIEFEDFVKFYESKRYFSRLEAVKKELFPIKPSVELAGVAADLMADGHLQGKPKWRFDYCSNSIKELERFEGAVYNLFKIKGKIRQCTTNKYGTMNYGVNCKHAAIILFMAGVPAGEKVSQSYCIPGWILSNKDFFARFVQRYFDCEGHVSNVSKSIEFQIYKTEPYLSSGVEFVNNIKFKLAHYFDINAVE